MRPSFEDLETRRADAGRARVAREGIPRDDSARTSTSLTTKFSEHRIDYTMLNTAEPLDRALFSYLSSARAADEGPVTWRS